MAKKAPQGSQTKVETLTIRVSPKMKFGLELLSRKQHRTLTSVAEWALDMALNDPENGLWHNNSKGLIAADGEFILDQVWDPDESDRFIKLAIFYPYLLNYEEEILWKLIKENGFLWKGRYDHQEEWVWTCNIDSIIIERLRGQWETFKKVAEGDLLPSALPTWEKSKPPSTDDLLTEDDVPF